MEKWRLTLKAFWRIAFLAAVLVGCTGMPLTHEDRISKMNTLPPKIATLFQKTKTVCFGRFMIDLPETAELVWGPMAVPYDLSVYPGEGPKIKAEIKAKVDKITSIKHTEEPSMLIGVFDSVNPDSKIVVGYDDRHSASGAQLYSYIRLDRVAFVQSIPSSAMVVEDKSNPYGIRVDKTLYKKDVEELQDIARRLRLRNENEIPEEPGVCIEEGFIAKSLDFDSERIAIGFRFPEMPDVTFAVQTISMTRPNKDSTLEAALKAGREEAYEQGLGGLFNRIKTLRKADRKIGQWNGAESLARLPSTKTNPESHEFVFKTPGEAKDMLRPWVQIDFYTGVKENSRGEVPPSLTDEEAVAMWDRLTSTIRVRPVKENPSDGKGKPESSPPAPKPGAQAPQAPLKQLATGEPCTRTGLWRCVENGKTRAFSGGQAMPEAVFNEPATGLLNRIKGIKHVITQGPGHWEWVGERPEPNGKNG